MRRGVLRPSPWASPKGTAEEKEIAWHGFWDCCDLLRAMVARPEPWGSIFLSSFAGILKPRERLSIPGAMEKVIWVGGDATLQVAGQIDWGEKLCVRQEIGQPMAALREAADLPEEHIIIALGELFGLGATRRLEVTRRNG